MGEDTYLDAWVHQKAYRANRLAEGLKQLQNIFEAVQLQQNEK